MDIPIWGILTWEEWGDLTWDGWGEMLWDAEPSTPLVIILSTTTPAD